MVTERNVNDICAILCVPAQDYHSMNVSCGSSVSNVVSTAQSIGARSRFEAGRRRLTRIMMILFSTLFQFHFW